MNIDRKVISLNKITWAIDTALFHTLYRNPRCLWCLYLCQFEKAFGPERNFIGCSQAFVKWCWAFVLTHVAMEKKIPSTSQGPNVCKQICAVSRPPHRSTQKCNCHWERATPFTHSAKNWHVVGFSEQFAMWTAEASCVNKTGFEVWHAAVSMKAKEGSTWLGPRACG